MSKILVETYEVEDALHSEASTMALDAEAAELIERLGLTGQKSLQNPETLTRCPYPVAEEEALAVFRALNPESCAPELYSLDPIPVRVLQVLEHAKSLNFFTSFAIWYPKSARLQDPVLVAHRKWRPSTQQWDTTDTHVLARWGAMLKPLDVLRADAIAMLRPKIMNDIARARGELLKFEERAKTSEDFSILTHHVSLYMPS